MSLEERRQAARELGEAMRRLSEAAVLSVVEPERVRAATAAVRAAAEVLEEQQRGIRQVPSVDDLAAGIRFFSPISGIGHPSSVPLDIESHSDGSVTGRAIFGARFEGPPGLVHGGITALVFDETLGWAVIHEHAMTGHLEVTYRRGVPLGEPVVVRARITEHAGRKIRVEGELALEADEKQVLASAHGIFIRPRDELRDEYFAGITDSMGATVVDSNFWTSPTT